MAKKNKIKIKINPGELALRSHGDRLTGPISWGLTGPISTLLRLPESAFYKVSGN